MTFKVTYNETTHIIESRVHGIFDWNLIERMAPAIAKLVLKKNCYLLFIDFRNCKVAMSTIKIYETPRKIAEEFAKSGVVETKLRRAILIDTSQKDFEFLENVTANNAQILNLFSDEESAIEWLTTLDGRKTK